MNDKTKQSTKKDKEGKYAISSMFIEWLLLVILGCLVIWACGANIADQSVEEMPEAWQQHLKPFEIKNGDRFAIHETVYLPVYTHIYYFDHTKLLNLAETVSIRNTDLRNSIVLTSVRHYSSNGTLLKDYVDEPIKLDPISTADFVVPSHDVTGGTGANFVIEWVSVSKVTKPIIESIMIYTGSSHSVSFMSRGEVIGSEENFVFDKQSLFSKLGDKKAEKENRRW